MRRATVAAFAAALLIVAVWLGRSHRQPADHLAQPVPVGAAAPIAHSASASTSAATPLVEVSHAADSLDSPATDINADLRLVADALATFRSNFPHDGNPVGSNAEITAALAGKNRRRVAFIPPNHPAINAAGELCDRWGTPFFFHAESGTKMEIRSAGPDKKMWTDDDVVLAP